jgi:signal transduction histidine kinase
VRERDANRLRAQSVQFFSLRTKLLLFAAVLVLLPGAIYGLITVSSSRAALVRVVGRQLEAEARNAADRLATTLRSERERLDSFASQDMMREIRIGDMDKRISSFLVSARRGCAACVDLLVLDRDGRIVASSNSGLIGGTATTILGAADVEDVISGPSTVPATAPRTVLRLAATIPDPDAPDVTLGRLVVLYDWARATEVIARVRENLVSVGLDAAVLVLDPQGLVIGGAAPRDGVWRPGATIRLPPSATQIDRTAGMLLGRSRLPADLPPWTIVAAQPLRDAFAPVRRTARLLAIALAGMLLVVLAMALAAARRVTRPLAELTAAAERVGRGGTAVAAVPVRSRDEIGTLAAAFNRMGVDLRRAERELVEAAKFAFVGELAAGVAHEVRTPLGVMRSSTQLLERSLEAKDDEMRELLQLLRDEVDRIERVVSGLLELARPRTLQLTACALGQIVFRAADFVDAQAREHGVVLRRQPIDPDPVAHCDPEMVYQVALNLLVNAVQILPPGGTVVLALLPPRGGRVGFEVRDDGPGMTDDVRQRIFEPFFTRRDGGSGLGLTFVQRVVQEHRGVIAVESTVGRGTVFRVELPVAEEIS